MDFITLFLTKLQVEKVQTKSVNKLKEQWKENDNSACCPNTSSDERTPEEDHTRDSSVNWRERDECSAESWLSKLIRSNIPCTGCSPSPSRPIYPYWLLSSVPWGTNDSHQQALELPTFSLGFLSGEGPASEESEGWKTKARGSPTSSSLPARHSLSDWMLSTASVRQPSSCPRRSRDSKGFIIPFTGSLKPVRLSHLWIAPWSAITLSCWALTDRLL